MDSDQFLAAPDFLAQDGALFRRPQTIGNAQQPVGLGREFILEQFRRVAEVPEAEVLPKILPERKIFYPKFPAVLPHDCYSDLCVKIYDSRVIFLALLQSVRAGKIQRRKVEDRTQIKFVTAAAFRP